MVTFTYGKIWQFYLLKSVEKSKIMDRNGAFKKQDYLNLAPNDIFFRTIV